MPVDTIENELRMEEVIFYVYDPFEKSPNVLISQLIQKPINRQQGVLNYYLSDFNPNLDFGWDIILC